MLPSRGLRPAATLALILSATCATAQVSPTPPTRERVSLAAAFLGGNPRGLAELLHPDIIVQPPAPDSAVQGRSAIAYLTDLATGSRLAASELSPQSFSKEGPFLLEQGTWIVTSGDRVLGSRYHLRWRRLGGAWRVVLLRWTGFQ